MRNTTDGAEELHPLQEYMSRSSISPDGRLIAYKGAKGLGVYDLETKKARILVQESEMAWARINPNRKVKDICLVTETWAVMRRSCSLFPPQLAAPPPWRQPSGAGHKNKTAKARR